MLVSIIYSNIYFILLEKNRLPARRYIVFRVSIDLTCIIILRQAACVRNLCIGYLYGYTYNTK